MLLGPLTRSWGTRLVSLTLTLLREPMAAAAQSWPSRCGCQPSPDALMWLLEAPRPAPSLCAFLPTPQLLEYEPRSGEQVPLLLKMKRSKLALSKAIESGDTDLGEQGLGEGKSGAPGLSEGLS